MKRIRPAAPCTPRRADWAFRIATTICAMPSATRRPSTATTSRVCSAWWAWRIRGAELVGQIEERPRWRRATQLVGSSLGEVVGKEYVARHFPAASKARMEELVDQVKRAFGRRIENLSWMTPQTKAKALEKLDL